MKIEMTICIHLTIFKGIFLTKTKQIRCTRAKRIRVQVRGVVVGVLHVRVPSCEAVVRANSLGEEEEEEEEYRERKKKKRKKKRTRRKCGLEISKFSVVLRFRSLFLDLLKVSEAPNSQNVALPELRETADIADFVLSGIYTIRRPFESFKLSHIGLGGSVGEEEEDEEAEESEEGDEVDEPVGPERRRRQRRRRQSARLRGSAVVFVGGGRRRGGGGGGGGGGRGGKENILALGVVLNYE